MKARVTRVEGVTLAPGYFGPYLFEGQAFRLFRVGPIHFEGGSGQERPSTLERWELREGIAATPSLDEPTWTTIAAGADESTVLDRFGFTL